MIGLKIIKYDSAELQITIPFQLLSAIKNFLNWVTKCNGIAKCKKFGL